jgi:hypothetical protein
MQFKLAQSYGSHVTGGSGYCARSHQQDLGAAGLGKWVGSGNAWDMGQRMLRSGEWAQVDPHNARPGDSIYFHDPSYYGDVRGIKSRQGDRILTVNDHWNQAFSVDQLGNHPFRRNSHSNYDRSIVLRYIGDQSRQYAANQATQGDS